MGSLLPGGYLEIFLLFIIFSMFAVLNVVTAVFVDNAVQSSNADRQVIISEERQKHEEFLKSMQQVFEELDTDHTHTISREEFERQVQDEGMVSYFKALDLDVTQARTLFTLLDVDNTGSVDIEEFIIGCMKKRRS